MRLVKKCDRRSSIESLLIMFSSSFLQCTNNEKYFFLMIWLIWFSHVRCLIVKPKYWRLLRIIIFKIMNFFSVDKLIYLFFFLVSVFKKTLFSYIKKNSKIFKSISLINWTLMYLFFQTNDLNLPHSISVSFVNSICKNDPKNW